MSQRDTAPRRISGQKQNTFFGGAAILAVGILVVKLIGMFYKIPLVNIIGEQGNTDFTNAYNIYAVLLTISTAGLPVAVSKLVSEASALGRHNQMRKTFRVSMLLFLSLGLISFLVMYFKADTLAAMMNDTKACLWPCPSWSARPVPWGATIRCARPFGYRCSCFCPWVWSPF